jgi:hypothetical protein
MSDTEWYKWFVHRQASRSHFPSELISSTVISYYARMCPRFLLYKFLHAHLHHLSPARVFERAYLSFPPIQTTEILILSLRGRLDWPSSYPHDRHKLHHLHPKHPSAVILYPSHSPFVD